jgi:antitoxin component YwqK of YwqJK toxin-antitoxin module
MIARVRVKRNENAYPVTYNVVLPDDTYPTNDVMDEAIYNQLTKQGVQFTWFRNENSNTEKL